MSPARSSGDIHFSAKVDAEANIADVAAMFLRDDYRRYPVIRDNRLVGQISRRDVLRALEALW